MKRRVSVPWVALLVLCVAVADAAGTKLLYRSPKYLAAESTQIVRGRVSSVSSFWNDRHTNIFTEARILQLSGIVGHVNMRVEGALDWKESEEVLVFLEPGMPGTFNVAGFSQGKFAIERDPRTGRAFVHAPDLAGADVAGKPGARAGSGRISLDAFVAKTILSE